MRWNKITWYSKLVALVLFVALPFVGFYYGTQYGRTLQIIADAPASSASMAGAVADYAAAYYANTAAWQTDANNTRGGFSIAYPIDFDAQDNYTAAPSADWSMSANGVLGVKYFTLTVPRAFEPQTNFVDATLTVGASGNAAAVADCTATGSSPQGPDTSVSTATVNGVMFTVFRSTGAGAGNYYETTSYRTVHSGKCYAVEYTIHSAQIMNYPPQYGLHPFDRARIMELLDRMVGTFKFL